MKTVCVAAKAEQFTADGKGKGRQGVRKSGKREVSSAGGIAGELCYDRSQRTVHFSNPELIECGKW